jgi:hypothetical protein
MPVLPAVVASLIPCGLGAIGRNVAHPSTIEATTVLGSGLVDHLPVITLKTGIFAVPGDMTSLVDIAR